MLYMFRYAGRAYYPPSGELWLKPAVKASSTTRANGTDVNEALCFLMLLCSSPSGLLLNLLHLVELPTPVCLVSSHPVCVTYLMGD